MYSGAILLNSSWLNQRSCGQQTCGFVDGSDRRESDRDNDLMAKGNHGDGCKLGVGNDWTMAASKRSKKRVCIMCPRGCEGRGCPAQRIVKGYEAGGERAKCLKCGATFGLQKAKSALAGTADAAPPSAAGTRGKRPPAVSDDVGKAAAKALVDAKDKEIASLKAQLAKAGSDVAPATTAETDDDSEGT